MQAEATAQKYRQMLDDPQSCLDPKIKLAAVVDVGVHFVKATYHLEGDGPLIISVHFKKLQVQTHCQMFLPMQGKKQERTQV